ncbi:MAG: hypothetical protein H7X86_12330 [Gorillibacterium sp.]|nr:hypothetical protein [Gorillibacterium sp.]
MSATQDTELLYFGVIGGVAILLAILLYLFAPKIHGYMNGIQQPLDAS